MTSTPSPPDGRSFAILRVKRKRGDGPLDALVIEQASPKRTRRGVPSGKTGIFRFAATVELASFTDNEETKRLEDRIKEAARDRLTASPVNATAVKEQRLSAYRKSAHQARFRVVQDRRDSFDELAEGSPPLENATKQREEYSRGIGRGKSRFTRIWDAVEEAPGRRAGISNGAGTEMDQFEAMLQEYLKVSDDAQSAARPRARPAEPISGPLSEATAMDSDDSYVYDVYYQARAPVAGEEVIEAVGALSGLTAEDLMNEDSGESDSDKVMTDDEDSNEEDFYRNDYPEGEESSSEEEEPDDPFADGNSSGSA